MVASLVMDNFNSINLKEEWESQEEILVLFGCGARQMSGVKMKNPRLNCTLKPP